MKTKEQLIKKIQERLSENWTDIDDDDLYEEILLYLINTKTTVRRKKT